MTRREEHLPAHTLDWQAAEPDALPTSAAERSHSDKQVFSPGSPQAVPVSSSRSSFPAESNLQKRWAHATVSEVRRVVS